MLFRAQLIFAPFKVRKWHDEAPSAFLSPRPWVSETARIYTYRIDSPMKDMHIINPKPDS